MKVVIAVVLALGSASAIGSGPYLPSGWRPDGPAFFLPSEPRLTTANPLQDVIFQGSEASGSDFLREYGPPKLQELPKEVTEQAFVEIEAKFEEEGVSVEASTEAIAELRSALVEDSGTTTEAQIAESIEEVTAKTEDAIQGRSLNLEVETVGEDEGAAQVYVEATEAAEVSPNIEAEKIVEEEIKNVAEAIVNLEEKVVEQVQFSQDITEIPSIEQKSGVLAQVPQGFLEYGPPGFQEYGPPGFKEYGPPKQDLLRNEEANTGAEAEKIESNETRRRRFSPKFRSLKNIKLIGLTSPK